MQEGIFILSQVKEAKILLNKKSVFSKNKTDDVIDFEKLNSIIYFINENLHEQKPLTYSLIADNCFSEELYEIVLNAVQLIFDLNKDNKILLYTNGNNLNDDYLMEMKKYNTNIIVCKENEYSINEEDKQSILKYFPLSHFHFYMNSKNYDIETIWNEYKNDNCFYFNFFFDETDSDYTEDILNSLNNQLNNLDNQIIDKFENLEVPVIPDVYRYMFWKKGVNDYFVRNKRFSIIPESANGVRCGQGCNQSLSFDITGDVYTCIKQIDNGKENIFYLGNIEEEIDENKIINILSLHSEEIDSNVIKSLQKANQTQYGSKCYSCELQSVCTQGCSPINYTLNKAFLTPSDFFCYWNKICYSHAVKIITHFDLFKNNDLFKDYYLGSLIKGEGLNEC